MAKSRAGQTLLETAKRKEASQVLILNWLWNRLMKKIDKGKKSGWVSDKTTNTGDSRHLKTRSAYNWILPLMTWGCLSMSEGRPMGHGQTRPSWLVWFIPDRLAWPSATPHTTTAWCFPPVWCCSTRWLCVLRTLILPAVCNQLEIELLIPLSRRDC